MRGRSPPPPPPSPPLGDTVGAESKPPDMNGKARVRRVWNTRASLGVRVTVGGWHWLCGCVNEVKETIEEEEEEEEKVCAANDALAEAGRASKARANKGRQLG